MGLLDKLREKDKKGYFRRTQTAVSYPTGFVNLDYRNGYYVEVRNEDNELVKKYPSVGMVGGSFITIIGKSGVAKTTAAVQFAANIVRNFNNGFVVHFDVEQALTYTRIRNVTGWTTEELKSKYILKQERTYIEDIFDTIVQISEEKISNFNEYSYETGLLNEFNEPIRMLVPTVIILDSIPTVSAKEKKTIELEGGTYANRVAKDLAQFYKRLTPIIKEANIIFFAINHINNKIEINPMVKTQPQLLGMKMDESMPGGNAPIYYAHNVLKFVTNGKFTKEEHGFDGFRVRCEFLKSRTNKSIQSTVMIYNQETGFDPIQTQYEFANDNGLVEGRNPYRYFINNKDIKFDSRKFKESFLENVELRTSMFDNILPVLKSQLSTIDLDSVSKANKSMDVFYNLLESQENEEFDENE